MERNIKFSYLFVFLILYCLLASAQASVTISYNVFIELAVAVLSFIYFRSKNAIKGNKSIYLASFLLIVAILYSHRGGNLFGYIGPALTVSLALVLLNMKAEWRIILLERISKLFGILLSISIILWFIHLFISLPHTTTTFDNHWGGYSTIANYFFFQEFVTPGELQRFQGMFLEPGHLGTISSFFLIVNEYNFRRKENIVFLISIILSLSASAFVLTAIGFLLYWYNSRKVITALSFLAIIVIFFIYYNGGDNVVNNLIFSKLTREEGAVEGRVTLEIVDMFNEMWITGKDLLLGKGLFFAYDESQGSGLILYFVKNGIIGTLLLFLSYFAIYRTCKSRYGFYILLIYYISFLQRTYPFWDAFIIPFILGLSYVSRPKGNIKVTK